MSSHYVNKGKLILLKGKLLNSFSQTFNLFWRILRSYKQKMPSIFYNVMPLEIIATPTFPHNLLDFQAKFKF